MNSLIQLSRALNEARAEKEAAVAQAIAQTKADRMEAAADAKEEQLIKVSMYLTLASQRTQNCRMQLKIKNLRTYYQSFLLQICLILCFQVFSNFLFSAK